MDAPQGNAPESTTDESSPAAAGRSPDREGAARLSQRGKQLYRLMGQAVETWDLIQDEDRVMVALSGGKDSYAMYVLLDQLRRRWTKRVELVAVHLDQGHPGYDGRPLERWLRDQGGEFHILREDTYTVVTDKVPEGKTYCSLCSRLRRGILYTAADDLRCNKIALGHHRDDALETLLLNIFFSGRIAAMPARLISDDGRHVVIRPLLYCPEEFLIDFAAEQNFPILPCNLCGSQSQAQRAQMKDLLARMEAVNPTLRQTMLAALGNVNPRFLLDPGLQLAGDRAPDSGPAEPQVAVDDLVRLRR